MCEDPCTDGQTRCASEDVQELCQGQAWFPVSCDTLCVGQGLQSLGCQAPAGSSDPGCLCANNCDACVFNQCGPEWATCQIDDQCATLSACFDGCWQMYLGCYGDIYMCLALLSQCDAQCQTSMPAATAAMIAQSDCANAKCGYACQ